MVSLFDIARAQLFSNFHSLLADQRLHTYLTSSRRTLILTSTRAFTVPNMDMGSTMTMGGAPSDSPLNASGIDFSNSTQASTFLGEILDDTVFQVNANMYTRVFWYGVCSVIATCSFFNVVQKATFKIRYVSYRDALLHCGLLSFPHM